MATIRNIAQLAGVSVPTVSWVLNDQRVDPVMALKVRKAAQTLVLESNLVVRESFGQCLVKINQKKLKGEKYD